MGWFRVACATSVPGSNDKRRLLLRRSICLDRMTAVGLKQPPNDVRCGGSFPRKQPSRPAPPARFIATFLGRCHVDTIEVMHANGRRVAQDYAAAVNWYPKARKAADQGSRRGPRLG
jgi:hypothetical protein